MSGKLILDKNVFRGSIPLVIGTLSQLREFLNQMRSRLAFYYSLLLSYPPADTYYDRLIYLGNLSLAENALTGTIPDTLSRLTNLESLSLHTNPQLEGSIPVELCSTIGILGVEDVGCDIDCSCCVNVTQVCGDAPITRL
jgi:hypothetical protein